MKDHSILNYIVSNPFRVLGLYTNARQIEIVRNARKMEAFLRVGKDIGSSNDFNAVLPPLSRTVEEIQTAGSKLAFQRDRVLYSFFWFCSFDDYDSLSLESLKQGALQEAKDRFFSRESVSSIVNLAVVAIIQEDYGKALSYYGQLIHNQHNRSFFIEIICGVSGSFTESELSGMLLDTLFEPCWNLYSYSKLSAIDFLTLTENPADQQYLQNKILSAISSRLDDILLTINNLEDDFSVFEFFAWDEYRKIVKDIKQFLQLCSHIHDQNDVSHIIKQTDDIASLILGLSLRYYNDENSSEEERIDTALSVINDIVEFAHSDTILSQCRNAIATLTKRKEAIPPEIVLRYDKSLSLFEKKLTANYISFKEIESILKDSCPLLVSIKTALGDDSPYYLHRSTSFATSLLNKTISILNDELWKYERYCELRQKYKLWRAVTIYDYGAEYYEYKSLCDHYGVDAYEGDFYDQLERDLSARFSHPRRQATIETPFAVREALCHARDIIFSINLLKLTEVFRSGHLASNITTLKRILSSFDCRSDSFTPLVDLRTDKEKLWANNLENCKTIEEYLLFIGRCPFEEYRTAAQEKVYKLEQKQKDKNSKIAGAVRFVFFFILIECGWVHFLDGETVGMALLMSLIGWFLMPFNVLILCAPELIIHTLFRTKYFFWWD